MPGVERERIEEGIEVVRLDRPERRNALDTATLRALIGALGELAGDERLRAVVISTTSERALCAGADVAEPLDREGGVARMEAFAELYAALDAFPAPLVCVCVGNVVGAGAEIAAASDLRVGGDNLKLMWAGARMGAPVGPARLVPLVGLATAKDLILTGRVVGLEEALALRLVHRGAPAGEAEAVAIELARAVAAHDAGGVRALKRMFRELERTEERVGDENRRLVGWQREGAGLPSGSSVRCA